ncbi:MAG: phospho-N-acetylmuramoyl-pentapeptide-transferase [bacterium]|nr:phospho-N-acetylmuramoyl-pentapeptide-transferase [bacterium]
MLYYLYEIFSLNIFQYITFRSAGALMTALILSYFFGKPIINKLKRLKADQQIRIDGPTSHQDKQGTPTMGGIIILLSIFFTSILWARLDNRFIIICLISLVYFGFLGFMDDYLKLRNKNHHGLSGRKKLFFQTVLGFLVAIYLYFNPANTDYATIVDVPYLKNAFINLGVFYILFEVIIIVGASNAVNLTDGLDGLAIGLILISALTYLLFAYLVGNMQFSGYLMIIPVAGAGEIAVFLAALTGAGLGFLWYNAHPAEVFMGDTGSLCLGGILGIVAVLIKQELLLILVGGVFVVETLSVMIQVYSFKKYKRRVFKMAPIHHHFELLGWSETKVVMRFWIIGIILALIALSALKLR